MTTATEVQYACPLCNYPIAVEGLCRRCVTRLHTQLDDLIDLWRAAHDELLPGKGGHGSASSERTIGLNVAALSFIAGDDILGLLHEWEKYIRTDRGLTPPAMLPKLPLEQEIATAIKFAQAHLEWSGTQPWIDDFARELRDLHGMATAAARKFVEKVRRIPCPADNEEGLPCGNLLAVRDDELLEVFGCRRCGSQWTSFRLIAVALANPGGQFWLDIEAIAAWIGITERGVRQIIARHDIARRGQLYDFKAILKARENVA
jgi:hypothetical protein